MEHFPIYIGKCPKYPQRVSEPMYYAFAAYLSFISMIQSLSTPYLIHAEMVLKFK